MKKIMFNDKYGLTQSVLEGRKTMTRRIVPRVVADSINSNQYHSHYADYAPYKVGEAVAVAQSYKDVMEECGENSVSPLIAKAGYTNKMFVKAALMIHQIRITDVRAERLQDISDEDVYKEGFRDEPVNNGWGNCAYHREAMLVYYGNIGEARVIRSPFPRDAFATLIDRISGKGTWESNPWVFVYEFELIK